MTEKDILKLIEDKKPIDRKLFDECLEFLNEDAEHDCVMLPKLRDFFSRVCNPSRFSFDGKLHLVVRKYLKKCERFNFNPDALYNMETLYLYSINSLAECVTYINKLIDMEEADVTYKINAANYMLTILLRRDLNEAAEPYIELLDSLLNAEINDLSDKAFILLNQLDYYAKVRDRHNYETRRSYLREICEQLHEDPLYEAIMLFVEMHDMYHEVMLSNGDIDREKLVQRVKVALQKVTNQNGITDDFATIFIPIFREIKDILPREELVEECCILISVTPNGVDKIDFYHFIINELGVDIREYPEQFSNYNEALNAYFLQTQEIKTHEIATELEKHEVALDYMYVKRKYRLDALTGLRNRSAYEEHIKKMQSSCGEMDFSNIAVIVMDVDCLKECNDNFGHEAGDDLLKRVANALMEVFDDDWYRVYRFGGDEFTVVAHGVDEETIKSKIRLIGEREKTDDFRLSCGYAFMSATQEHTVERAFFIADRKMYDNKNERKKNNYRQSE